MSLHFMPGLYGSTVEKDIDTFRQAFSDIYIRPDEIKFYPTSVIPNTELYELYESGEYTPLETPILKDIIKTVQINYIPPYTRIKRLIRDIPATEIAAGSNISNLRQLVDHEMHAEYASDEEKRSTHYPKLYPNIRKYATYAEFLDDISNPPRPPFVRGETSDCESGGSALGTSPKNKDIS